MISRAILFLFLVLVGNYEVQGQEEKSDLLTPTNKMLEMYAGEYVPAKKTHLSPMSIIMKEGRIYRHLENDMDRKLDPVSDKKFVYSDDSKRSLEFIFDQYGNVTHVSLKRRDGVFLFEKVKQL